MAGSRNNGTDNSIHMDSIRSNPGPRTQLRSKLERQNAAPERKPVTLSPIRLREVFSLFFLLMIKQETEGKVFRFYFGPEISGYAVMQTLWPIRRYEIR